MRTPVEYTTTEFWEPLLRRKEVLIEDFELFDQYWVVNERENGLSRLRIMRWDQSEDYHLLWRRKPTGSIFLITSSLSRPN